MPHAVNSACQKGYSSKRLMKNVIIPYELFNYLVDYHLKGEDYLEEEIRDGLEEKLVHRPHEKSDKPIYVYGLYELKNGASAFEVMSWEAVMNHAKKLPRPYCISKIK